MPQGDRRTGRALDLEPQPADHVLAHVDDRVARRRLEDLDWSHRLDPADRRPRGGDEIVLAVIDDPDPRPLPVVEADVGPARALQARVVGLAVVDLGHQDGTGGGLPARVAADGLPSPILVGDLDLQEQSEAIAVDVATASRQVSAVPAVAEQHAHGVVPALEQGRDVVGLVLQALVVARPARGEELVAHPLAVEVQLVEPVARHVGARARDGSAQLEHAAQHGHRPAGLHVLREVGLDPARLPVGGLEEAHLPGRRRAPGGRRPSAIPDPDLPVIAQP